MIGKIAWEEEEERRTGFNIAWILLRPVGSCTSDQFKDIQEVLSLILHCKTVYCYRMTFAEYVYHNGSAFEMHSIIKSGLITGGKSLRKGGQSVFFTAVSPMCVLDKIWKKLNTIWTNPESHRTNTLGELITIQFFWCNYQIQILFQAHYQRFVKKTWYA